MTTSAPISHVEPPRTGLRLAILTFAVLLALDAVWMVAPELSRAASNIGASRGAGACAASRIVLVRGDLWTACALADADPFRTDRSVEDAGMSGEVAVRARGAVERAVVLAPHDARAWLILADFEARFDWTSRKGAAALRMSYYTGPNETALIPMRLATFARLDVSADPELRQLVGHELTTVIKRKPNLSWAIGAAYRDALPAGKKFLETTVREIDPKFLALLGS